MRILQINACHYNRGGSETVYFNSAELLKKHGHEVIYFSTNNPDNVVTEFARYFISNADIRGLSFFGKIMRAPSYLYNVKARRKIRKLVMDFRPDIAHVHIFYAELSVSILRLLKELNIPVIHTVHDYRLLCPVDSFIDYEGKVCELCQDRRYIHCLLKRCSEGKISQSTMVMLEAYFWKYFVNPIDYIDHFIFVSNFCKEKHLAYNRAYAGKSSHLYNFTKLEDIGDQQIRGNYFLYFGRLSAEKGIENLLTAFTKKAGIKLKIAGKGKLQHLVEKYSGSDSNIEYLGFKTGCELEELIRNSSFIIVPSIWYENNPMTIIEAFSFGKPVIGSDIGGIPEIISHRKNGLLFRHDEPESLYSMLIEADGLSDDEYKKFSDSAIKTAREKFAPEIHYQKLMELYQNLVNRNPENIT